MMEEKKGQGQASAGHPEHETEKAREKHGRKEAIADIEAARDKAQAEAKEQYDRLLRVSADFDNYKKRVAKEKADLTRYGNEELIKALLPVIDNLERALEHAAGGGEQGGIKDGVKMTLQQFLQILQRFGTTAISAAGERFDPTRHEAVMEQATGEHDPGHVVAELEKGYLLNDRLVRPAKVVVAKAHEDAAGHSEAEESEKDREE
jgi:molecular chaperone GrpE